MASATPTGFGDNFGSLIGETGDYGLFTSAQDSIPTTIQTSTTLSSGDNWFTSFLSGAQQIGSTAVSVGNGINSVRNAISAAKYNTTATNSSPPVQGPVTSPNTSTGPSPTGLFAGGGVAVIVVAAVVLFLVLKK